MGTRTAVDTRPDTATDVLAAARDRRRTADLAEAELCQLAVQWAVMHPADSIPEPATFILQGCGQTDLELAGPGAPSIAEYAVPELAAAIGLSTEAGKNYSASASSSATASPGSGSGWSPVTWSPGRPAWSPGRPAG